MNRLELEREMAEVERFHDALCDFVEFYVQWTPDACMRCHHVLFGAPAADEFLIDSFLRSQQ